MITFAAFRGLVVILLAQAASPLAFGKMHKKRIRDSSADPLFKLRGTKGASITLNSGGSGGYSAEDKQLTKTTYPGVLPSLQYWRASPTRPASPYPEFAVSSDPEKNKGTKYMTFETDLGGWNNIRLQVEICLILAHVTGRTLILPGAQVLYLLDTPAKDLGEYYDASDWSKGISFMTAKQFGKLMPSHTNIRQSYRI